MNQQSTKTPDELFRENKWDIRIVKRGADYDVADIVKCLGFLDEVTLSRAMWPHYAKAVVDEHNEALAKILFKQE